jgi:hypothetical protein
MSLGIDSDASTSSRLSSMARSAEECTDFSVSNVLSIGQFEQPYRASVDCLGTTRVHAHILLAFNVRRSTKYVYYVGDCVYPMSTAY